MDENLSKVLANAHYRLELSLESTESEMEYLRETKDIADIAAYEMQRNVFLFVQDGLHVYMQKPGTRRFAPFADAVRFRWQEDAVQQLRIRALNADNHTLHRIITQQPSACGLLLDENRKEGHYRLKLLEAIETQWRPLIEKGDIGRFICGAVLRIARNMNYAGDRTPTGIKALPLFNVMTTTDAFSRL